MFVFLWSCGFIARRVFDKMISYFIKRCPLSFQVPSIQRLSAGACFALKDTLIFSLWELTVREIFKQYEMLMWFWLPTGEIFQNCYLNYHLCNVIIAGLIPVFWRLILNNWASECILRGVKKQRQKRPKNLVIYISRATIQTAAKSVYIQQYIE